MQDYVFQSLWNANNCHGAPDAMFLYNWNETFYKPQFYTYLSEEYPEFSDYCGMSYMDFPFGCCWETYYPTDYTSSNVQFLSTLEDIAENTPKSVIGHSYCQLKYDGDAGRVYTYLLDQHSCYDSVLSCLDGVLTIYAESSNCEGDHLEQYSQSTDDINSAYFGEHFSFEWAELSEGSMSISWIAYLPYNENIIYPNSAGRIIAVIGLVFPFFINSMSLCWAYLRMYRTQSLINTWLCLIQSMMFIESCIFVAWYFVKYSNDSHYFYYQFSSLAWSLTSFSLSLMNIQLFINIVPNSLWELKWQKIAIYLLVLVVHLLLYWPSYLMYFFSGNKFFVKWALYGGLIWDMFSICTCTLSTIFLASYRAWKKLIRDESEIRYLDIFTELRKTMPLSFGFTVFSIFNFLFFIIIYCIAYFSGIAGNDIDQYIIEAYTCMIFRTH